jgi:hypothetical protein
MSNVTRRMMLALVVAVLIAPALAAEPAKKPAEMMIILAEREYQTEKTVPKFAERFLAGDFHVRYVVAPPGSNDLAGMEKLDEVDIVLISVRRRAPTAAQMAALRRFVVAGKPVVGIRTSSHAFNLRGKPTPAGHAVWDDFDAEVLGCHYADHYANAEHPRIDVVDGAGGHPILRGVKLPLTSGWSLYKSSPLTGSAKALLMGKIEGHDAEPVAWTNTSSGGGRVFYTSLGHVGDFEQDSLNHLLRNGIYWAAGLPIGE